MIKTPKPFPLGAFVALTVFAALSRFAPAQSAPAQAAPTVAAQAEYPFRDAKLSDEQRIADLLSRLTLEEKVSLMSGAPKVPRLGLALSSQVEGLHGLALGGPGGWGGRGRQPLPTTTFPQEKGLGATWDA